MGAVGGRPRKANVLSGPGRRGREGPETETATAIDDIAEDESPQGDCAERPLTRPNVPRETHGDADARPRPAMRWDEVARRRRW